MSFLARWSLANRGLVALVTLVVAGFGAFAVPSLKQQLLPQMSFPMVSVSAVYVGAAPEVVERQVTVPLEDALRGVDGVTEITSTSSESSSSVLVAFEFGVDLDEAQADVDKALASVGLPDDVEPRSLVGSTEDLPVVQLAVSSGEDQQLLAERLERQVVPELAAIDGVKEATVSGARERVVTITPDAGKLASKGLTATSIADAIRAAGTPFPAGSVSEGEGSLTVQVGAAFDAVEDLEDLYLTPPVAPQGTEPPAPVRLGDVAEVALETTEATSLTRTDGQPSLGLSITMSPDGNAVDISHDVRDALPELASGLGSGATMTVVSDQAPAIEESIADTTTEGLLGLAMAVLIILVFLFSVRSTLVTAVSIPLSVLIALIALWTQNYTLNLLTLGGLTIAIGRVVDDSIVVLENIGRHLAYGEPRRQAILNAVREVAGAVTSSTLTTVAVFLPIAFVGGLVGQLFGAFSFTVTIALLASLLVSLTAVPVLAYWFMKTPKNADREAAERKERNSLLQRAYVPVLRFATKHRLTTVALALVILVGTLSLVPQLETSFIDNAGQRTVSVTQTLPPGTSLETADGKAKEVESVIAGIDDVEMYQVTVGGAGGLAALFGGGGGSSKVSYSLTLDEDGDTDAVEQTLRDTLGARADLGEIAIGEAGGFGGDSLEVRVTADDPAVLKEASSIVEDAMARTPGVTEVTSSIAETVPRVQVTVDREAAAQRGLSEVMIGQLVTQAMRGTTVTQLSFDQTTADVILKSGDDAPASIADLKKLVLVPGVKLSDVAEVARVDGPVSVARADGERSATVTGTNTGESLGTATAELTKRLDGVTMPAGASYEIGGASQDQSEAFGNLGLAAVAAIALVFMILVATFRSLIQPLILLVSIPFAATGAIGLLLATGTPLGLAAGIGLLMLIGIVVTNAIVLLDLINQYRRDGMPLFEAVIEGGRNRLRPILMTALATIFALTPMALGLTGGGGFISKPLAMVVIGGLVSSTLLTLVLVPTLYTMVERRKERRRERREAKRTGRALEETSTNEAEPVAVG
ncbi:efflux RND transporter permease subunit [Phytomonospora endophytica]|uniref:HAE1 family hydrophobic/amphiphilic exporter-1 n=1 Tax=Phytomonospora endophytica TaxID=714109 RepID=A0A841FJG8_9ACTN|nr:efflux RND transporter permease subunit [Phytomonospora endophytica]MBB6033297.1 HAE1 family hydrophobic/amphiphilic exporter-1 [Phytomonospora endophytica]